jgi:hypothetical protein
MCISGKCQHVLEVSFESKLLINWFIGNDNTVVGGGSRVGRHEVIKIRPGFWVHISSYAALKGFFTKFSSKYWMVLWMHKEHRE